jgi:hypothetical protein
LIESRHHPGSCCFKELFGLSVNGSNDRISGVLVPSSLDRGIAVEIVLSATNGETCPRKYGRLER